MERALSPRLHACRVHISVPSHHIEAEVIRVTEVVRSSSPVRVTLCEYIRMTPRGYSAPPHCNKLFAEATGVAAVGEMIGCNTPPKCSLRRNHLEGFLESAILAQRRPWVIARTQRSWIDFPVARCTRKTSVIRCALMCYSDLEMVVVVVAVDVVRCDGWTRKTKADGTSHEGRQVSYISLC